MKFKVYVWHTPYVLEDPDPSESYWTVDVDFIPSVSLSINRHNLPPDENCPIRRKGVNIFLVFSWLIFGITFDFRFGRDTGYWEGHEEE